VIVEPPNEPSVENEAEKNTPAVDEQIETSTFTSETAPYFSENP
jgi:hypothetical protein